MPASSAVADTTEGNWTQELGQEKSKVKREKTEENIIIRKRKQIRMACKASAKTL